MRTNKFKILYMILVGIVLTFIMKQMVYNSPQNHSVILDFLATIVITICVWEGNLRIDHWMNQKYPWVIKTKQRFFIQLLVAMLYSALSIYILMIVYNHFVCCASIQNAALMIHSFSIGIAVSFLLLTFEVSVQFFKGWKYSLIEMEKYKLESAQAQLQNLKNQINPHFLFNNLSVLTSLVHKDQEKAVDFINQLSKVYRYLLETRNSELVLLGNEMAFLQSYIYLLQIRFDANILFSIEIDSELNNRLLPPMALQVLVENAIKHNEISSEHPLIISIIAKDNLVIVSNNLQLRSNVEMSSKIGLKNLKDRYAYFTKLEVQIIESSNQFTVKIPLLEK